MWAIDLPHWWDFVVRAVVVYVFLLVLLRLTGKRQVGQLAPYFTSRRAINLPTDVIRRLEAEGHVETEANPLFLPRYSIRVMLILALAGVAVYLYRENRLHEPQVLSVLGLVFAYFLGVVLRFKRFRLWEDFKAAIVLLILLWTAGATFANRPDLVPYQLRDITLGLTVFYFGSRA